MTASFFLKWIAPVIAVLAVVGVIYGKGRLDSKHAAETADLKDQLQLSETLRASEQKAYDADAVQAKANADKLTTLNSNIDGLNAYVATLKDAGRECLSGADNDKLHQLWR
ncbi:hypothetical protein [Rhizobium sp. BK376]|uniref:hypothetical protein n=1 Tax=Rhizobium sp. BK376 TaxID=2512149 RepID=UPI0010509043|nr:hypothetical protein [Rhizobium sp. BK376]TCR92584.1 hypothetical protein EV561_10117 [Rhizobium sp. BK376]